MKNTFIFAMGAAAGAIVSGIGCKIFYDRKLAEKQEEIESVKEVYSKHFESSDKKEESTSEEADDEDSVEEREEMVNIIMRNNYSTASKTEPDVSNDVPYVIKPEEYGEFEDYMRISLTYFSDGTIVDENYDIVDDVDELLGVNVASHFGEYEDDSVHIRNDRTKCDYEILYDLRTYEMVTK